MNDHLLIHLHFVVHSKEHNFLIVTNYEDVDPYYDLFYFVVLVILYVMLQSRHLITNIESQKVTYAQKKATQIRCVLPGHQSRVCRKVLKLSVLNLAVLSQVKVAPVHIGLIIVSRIRLAWGYISTCLQSKHLFALTHVQWSVMGVQTQTHQVCEDMCYRLHFFQYFLWMAITPPLCVCVFVFVLQFKRGQLTRNLYSTWHAGV